MLRILAVNKAWHENTDGIWIKSQDSFIHIARVFPDKIIEEVSLYRFNEKQQLMESIFAEERILSRRRVGNEKYNFNEF